ncbi:ATP-binding protein [Pseudoalteromonas piscicida]|uniref:histidine kinase n=1 Tax=Pseudoalteromonas piscicida TaxID=43662 RepID=A0AAQ2EQA8_PSEO7|nr:ATP-binding protein [Pseudoalteromonas piscicida]TMN75304.1 ATP-binding protein [Pseudoalteromonas flavipulchra]KJY86134.1 histidine kinase [Pseudoalteromonas piscicida]TMN35417.1 ATP-binding protein [Pseudoalteromonas piscicida]TMN37968.1 ATP-binding protein [Pseudoalteromonas piscicida]TMN47137.1 ATP-binding protein [Pseudoalteromonas piscicida]
MKIAFSPNSALGQLLLLRSVAIVIQIVMLAIAAVVFGKQFDFVSVVAVVAAESVFQLLSIYAYRNTKEAAPIGMTMQLLADILFLTILLDLTGGATNAFVSLLVLPTVIAAVTIPTINMLMVSAGAIGAYLYLYIKMSHEHVHHMDMSTHLLGMLVNFTFTIIVVVTVVSILVKQNRKKERAIAMLREQQLQQEQLIALGSAAAQATHQLATPIAHLALLHEELEESYPKEACVQEMSEPLGKCKEQLNVFREFTEYLKSASKQMITVERLAEQLKELTNLQFPQQHFRFDITNVRGALCDDPMLMPSILNLISNGVRANEQAKQTDIDVTFTSESTEHVITILDRGEGIAEERLAQLGHNVVNSELGLGMAVLLSHATIERLGGHLLIESDLTYGTKCTVKLPRVSDEVTAC